MSQKMKKYLIELAAVVLVFALGFGAAVGVDAIRTAKKAAAVGGIADGSYTASAPSELGGEVSVTLTYQGGKIVMAEVDVSSQTPAIGGAHKEEYEADIVAKNGAALDSYTGATWTSTAVQKAYDAAMAAAMSGGSDGMKDGEYTAAAVAELPTNPESEVTVTIVIEGGVVVSATVDTSSQTPGIGAGHEAEFEADLVAKNGAAIDGVAGATITSGAIQAAYDACIAQAK